MKIGKWTHPKTGEVRFYLNGIGPDDAKVFVKEGENDAPELVIHCGRMIDKNMIHQLAGSWIDENGRNEKGEISFSALAAKIQ